MNFNWNLTPQEAIKAQQELRRKVSTKSVVANFSSRVEPHAFTGVAPLGASLKERRATPSVADPPSLKLRRITRPNAFIHGLTAVAFCEGRVKTVAGVDVSFPKEDIARAAVVVLTFPDLNAVDHARAEVEVSFPYIPGLLAFRECPAVVAAFEKLKTVPDLVIFDAQGLAHPRRLGLASHLGVLLDKPSIGCAKSKLCGEYKMPENKVGDYTLLKDKNETIGAVVRSKLNCQPLFVSIGHRIDLKTAVDFVLKCCQKYRLPEPTRLAHQLASGKPPTLPLRPALNGVTHLCVIPPR